MTAVKPKTLPYRNLFSFWIFGLCNNFVYAVMLSAAQDILNKRGSDEPILSNVTDTECIAEISTRICSITSTGVVLLCNILPSLCVKILSPFVMHRIPYWLRHTITCVAQLFSLVITALSESVYVALCGVCLGSFSSGLGETTYLGLASHYSKDTIATWSSGTGMAGIASSFSYAGLTDRRLLALSPSQAMLVMLVVPVFFMFTFFVLLEHNETMKKVGSIKSNKLSDLTTKGKLDQQSSTLPSSLDTVDDRKTWAQRQSIIKSLLRYMLPMSLTYFAEYLINQGLLELMVFDCKHGFGTTPASQYRWYQVLYQVGVFVSRSSIKIVQLNMTVITLLPVLQVVFFTVTLARSNYGVVNVYIVACNIISASEHCFLHPKRYLRFRSKFRNRCVIVLYEGFIGGGSYVNTFHHIHKTIDPSIREFALSTVTTADSFGILVAAIVAIPVHNSICALQWYHA